MHDTNLRLPEREAKPRRTGLTMMIDSGLPTMQFTDVIASHSEYIDVVKFGWGTSTLTADLKHKIDALADHQIDFYFGGTLFEKFVAQGRFEDWLAFCDRFGCRSVEVSNGTIDLTNEQKAGYVERLAADYRVFSEVGLKDSARSESMTVENWLDYLREDLEAGASYVITEARESGSSGICRANGELREDLMQSILASDLDLDRLLFEAPNKALQVYLIAQVGPNVSLGNIAPTDVVALETLRLGLRGDTLMLAELDALGAPARAAEEDADA
ncbi:MAG TPA: phosphosulfolactate synthase [Jatrophihabitans sp.]|nr:phosphosulfolactate synthase [Jatrophihabitans sp.]